MKSKASSPVKSGILSAAALLLTSCSVWPGSMDYMTMRARAAREFPVTEGETGRSIALPPSPDLSDYLDYADKNNPAFRAAVEKFKAALERVPQARALPDPRFSMGYFLSEIETREGPQKAKLSLRQMFPWPGKRGARAEAALREAEAALARVRATRLSVSFRVEKAYWDYWYLAQAVEVTRSNLDLLGYLESIVRNKYSTGSVPHSALMKIQVELAKLDDRLKELQDLRQPVSARLNAAIGRPSDTLLPWPEAPPPPLPETPDVQRLAKLLRERNPELAAAIALEKKSRVKVLLARKNYFPDIGVGLDYIFTGLDPSLPSSGKDAVAVSLSINIPIGRAKYHAAEREAKAEEKAAAAITTDRLNSLLSELQLAVFNLNDAARRRNLYSRTLVPKAKETLEAARKAFEAGKGDLLDVIDAERTLLAFQLSLARATADTASAAAKIRMLTGEAPHALPPNERNEP